MVDEDFHLHCQLFQWRLHCTTSSARHLSYCPQSVIRQYWKTHGYEDTMVVAESSWECATWAATHEVTFSAQRAQILEGVCG